MQRNLPATNDSLQQGHCVPCEGGTTPLSIEDETNYLDATRGWQILREGPHTLWRDFECKNFTEAIELTNKIAAIAESEQHHPNIYIHDYKKVKVELSTHAIGGLSTNDFILAAKINSIEQQSESKHA